LSIRPLNPARQWPGCSRQARESRREGGGLVLELLQCDLELGELLGEELVLLGGDLLVKVDLVGEALGLLLEVVDGVGELAVHSVRHVGGQRGERLSDAGRVGERAQVGGAGDAWRGDRQREARGRRAHAVGEGEHLSGSLGGDPVDGACHVRASEGDRGPGGRTGQPGRAASGVRAAHAERGARSVGTGGQLELLAVVHHARRERHVLACERLVDRRGDRAQALPGRGGNLHRAAPHGDGEGLGRRDAARAQDRPGVDRLRC